MTNKPPNTPDASEQPVRTGIAVVDSALRLAGIALVMIGLLGLVHWATRDRIAEQQRLAELRSIQAVLPIELYDNDPLSDVIEVVAPLSLGSRDPRKIYRARLANKPSALVLRATAPNGYNGDIELLIGVKQTGQIIGVRILRHRETPGLGDKIERRISPWIDRFVGTSLELSAQQWAVQKDGGQFDQFTGATITPRAVVKAVYEALRFAEQQQENLFSDQ